MDVLEHDGADVTPFSFSRDAADISASVCLFDDVLRSVKTNEEVRDNELLGEMFTSTFPGIRQKLVDLIGVYQEEDVIANLLTIYDKLEDISAQYLKRSAPPPDDTKKMLSSTLSSSFSQPHHSTTTTTTTTLITKTTTTTTTRSSNLALASIQVADDRARASSVDDADLDDLLEIERKQRERSVTEPPLKSSRKIMDEDTDSDTDDDDDEPVTTTTTTKKDTFVPFKLGYRVPEGPGECPICCEEEVPATDLYIFDQCSHQYCRECLAGYYNNLINDNKVLDITCPYPKCETHVEYHQVQDVVTQEQFSRYEEFTFLASLNADPTVRWCPKVGCGNAIIGDPENSKCVCTSPECKYEFCFQCSEPWHQDFSCEQYQDWKAENGMVDKKFSKWAKDNTKKCPNCKSLIEKMSGCNHMTCYKCKYEFCWLCNGKYSSNHFDVFNVLGCPGMQSGNKQFGMAKRLGMRALIGTGLVLGGVIGAALAIPAAVVAGPIYGGYKLHQHRVRRRRRSYYLR